MNCFLLFLIPETVLSKCNNQKSIKFGIRQARFLCISNLISTSRDNDAFLLGLSRGLNEMVWSACERHSEYTRSLFKFPLLLSWILTVFLFYCLPKSSLFILICNVRSFGPKFKMERGISCNWQWNIPHLVSEENQFRGQ